MNPVKTIVPEATGNDPGQISVTDAEEGFRTVLSNRKRAPTAPATPPELSGPATLSREAIVSGDNAPTLPDDDDETFLVVEDVSTADDDEDGDVAVVSGEAVEGIDEAVAVAEERGSSVVIALTSADFIALKVDGGLFASMLIDQRNGVLPNPFSLMRAPDRPVIDGAGAIDGQGVPATQDLFDETDIEQVQGGGVNVALGQELGREMSRIEAPVSTLEQRINRILGTLRARIGALPFFGGPPPP